MLSLRDAKIKDLEELMRIYRYAQDFMVKTNNPNQWSHSYPTIDLIKSDLEKKACKVIYDETGIHGVFALFTDEDPTYAYIENGHWLNNEPYITIHRIASDGQVHGIFQFAVDYCKSLSSNIRIDTHSQNLIMQKVIEKNGFIKCGTIYVRNHSPRIAYHYCQSCNLLGN
jgi:phage terminase large subunit-like protein